MVAFHICREPLSGLEIRIWTCIVVWIEAAPTHRRSHRGTHQYCCSFWEVPLLTGKTSSTHFIFTRCSEAAARDSILAQLEQQSLKLADDEDRVYVSPATNLMFTRGKYSSSPRSSSNIGENVSERFSRICFGFINDFHTEY